MVENVEYGHTGAHLEVPLAHVNCERPGHLQIEGRERGEPFGVSWADIIAIIAVPISRRAD